jgi:hypothetical protein
MNNDKRDMQVVPGHVGYSPDFKADFPAKMPKPQRGKATKNQKRIDYYTANYSVQTLAEMLVSLEDKYGIPPAID